MADTLTIDSGSAPYCTAARFALLHDPRRIAQLASQNDIPVADIAGNAVVAMVLSVAAGQIEAACTKGGRYTAANLAALQASGKNGAALLEKLNADLAFWELVKMKWPDKSPDDVTGVPGALELLDQLRAGTRILPFVEAQDAGVIDAVEMNRPNTTDPKSISQEAYRYFGQRFRGRGDGR